MRDPSVGLPDGKVEHEVTEECVVSFGKAAFRLQRNQLRHAIHHRVGDDGKVFGEPRIVTKVDTYGPNRRVISDSGARRNCTRSMGKIGDRDQIFEALNCAVADNRAVDEHRAIESMHQRNAKLDASLDHRRPTGWPWEEGTAGLDLARLVCWE